MSMAGDFMTISGNLCQCLATFMLKKIYKIMLFCVHVEFHVFYYLPIAVNVVISVLY